VGFNFSSMDAILKEIAVNIARQEVIWFLLASVAVYVIVSETRK
jgi:hypothetical protein